MTALPRRRSLASFGVTIYRDVPLCGESLERGERGLQYDYRCIVEMDGGAVASARIVQRDDEGVDVIPPVEVELTRAERETAEMDWAESRADAADAAREDAADARRDMERGL